MAKRNFLFSKSLLKRLPVLSQFSLTIEAALLIGMVRFLSLCTPEQGTVMASVFLKSFCWVFTFTARIRGNVSIAFPELSEREIRKLTKDICGNLGNSIADLVFADRIWREREQRVEFVYENMNNLNAYQQKAVVFVTGHIGAWQIAPLVAPCHGISMTSIFAPEENPYIRDFMIGLRKSLQTRFISRDGCMRHLLQALRQGDAVGLVADTRMAGGELIRLFGVPMAANNVAARLALREDCDLLPIRVERLPGVRFRITVGTAIRATNPEASKKEQITDMTSQLMRRFEYWIKDKPDEWMCFSRRWPEEHYH